MAKLKKSRPPIVAGQSQYLDYYKEVDGLQFFHELYKKYLPEELKKIVQNGKTQTNKTIADGLMQIVPVGPLQIWVVGIPTKKFLVISHVLEGGVGFKGKLEKWDEIHGVSGVKFSQAHSKDTAAGARGPIKDLGDAIEVAQQKGVLALLIKRNGKTKTVKLRIEKLGRFSKYYPKNCRKSTVLLDETASRLAKVKVRQLVSVSMKSIALLSTGNSKYLDDIEDMIFDELSKGDPSGSINNPFRISEFSTKSSWGSGSLMILLSEYFWATGDKRVFAALQQMANQVKDRHMNAVGAFGHGSGLGTYAGYHFGPTGGLNMIGLALAKKCGVKVDPAVFEKYYKFVTLEAEAKFNDRNFKFKYDPRVHYYSSYGGAVRTNDHMTESGVGTFNTSLIGLALGHGATNKEQWLLSKNIGRSLSASYFRYGYVHTTPLLGTFWSILAQTYLNPESLRTTFDYYKFWLTMSRSPEKVWYYFFSKKQVGGSFGGDGYLGYEQCQLSTTTIMLSASKLNLLLHGNKKRNWFSSVSPTETLKFIEKYHEFYASTLLAKGKALQRSKSREELTTALVTYQKGAKMYSGYTSGKKCLTGFNALKSRIGERRTNLVLARVDADVYLDYLGSLCGRVKKDLKTNILSMVVKEFDTLELESEQSRLLKLFDDRKREYDAAKYPKH